MPLRGSLRKTPAVQDMERWRASEWGNIHTGRVARPSTTGTEAPMFGTHPDLALRISSFWLFTCLRFFFKKDFIYLFLERRERKEGETHQRVVASHTPPAGDLACNPGMFPDWESNLWFVGLHSIHWATPARAVHLSSLSDPLIHRLVQVSVSLSSVSSSNYSDLRRKSLEPPVCSQ